MRRTLPIARISVRRIVGRRVIRCQSFIGPQQRSTLMGLTTAMVFVDRILRNLTITSAGKASAIKILYVIEGSSRERGGHDEHLPVRSNIK